jgi:xanthine dehydrogenase small subunit
VASEVKSLDALYPPAEMLAQFTQHLAESVMVRSGDKSHFKPVSIADAVAFKSANPDCTVVSGATDIGVLINKGIRDPKAILNLSGLNQLRSIDAEENMIHVGALVTIADLEKIAETAVPEYARVLHWFGSPPIKNAATIGGNIANGSPIGDSMPALFVLNAEIELTGTSGTRRVNINRFYTGYRKTVMATDEIITGVHIPLPDDECHFKLYKVSRRKDLDISAFSAAILLRVGAGRIIECRIAYGGVAATIVRLPGVEAYLSTNEFCERSFQEAASLARDEVRPISDVRGSADYRSQLAGNILLKFFHEIESQRKSGFADRNHNGNGHENGNGNGAAAAERLRNGRLNGDQ